MSEAVLRAQSVGKSFDSGPAQVDVLRDVNLEVAVGERLAVLGRSGSGKSTLLHILGGLDDPDTGEVWVGQKALDLGLIDGFGHLVPVMQAKLGADVKFSQHGAKKSLLSRFGAHVTDDVITSIEDRAIWARYGA